MGLFCRHHTSILMQLQAVTLLSDYSANFPTRISTRRMPASRHVLLLLVYPCLLMALSCQSPPTRKVTPPCRARVIQFGWGAPAPSAVLQQLATMEQMPFDGIVMRIPAHDSLFAQTAWTDDRFQQERAALAQIPWRRFTENYLALNVRSRIDWFHDEEWQYVLRHTGAMAEAARIGHCKGIVLDLEPYGPNPWQYTEQPKAGKQSFTAYQARVRQCGAQFMQAVAAPSPNVTVYCLFLLSILREIAAEPNAATRADRLAQSRYGLLPAFLNGMLDAAPPGVVLVDGNEPAYYYDDPRQYLDAYQAIHATPPLIAPENATRYATQVQCGQGIYLDRCFAPNAPRCDRKSRESTGALSQFHAQLAAVMRATDQPVWLWSQQYTWWPAPRVPDGLPAAIAAVKTEVAQARLPNTL